MNNVIESKLISLINVKSVEELFQLFQELATLIQA
jgi:hypothetical protein